MVVSVAVLISRSISVVVADVIMVKVSWTVVTVVVTDAMLVTISVDV